MSRTAPTRILTVLILGVTLFLRQGGAAEPSKLILALGDDSYIAPEEAKAWTGAEVKKALEEHGLLEFAVVILSNIPYGELPAAVREGLPEFVSQGGSVLITGGPNAYGSGGYKAVALLIPFEIRAEPDWKSGPFKPIIPLQPGHPVLQGVSFPPIGTFNDVNPAPGATEIGQYAGGKLPSGQFIFQVPLIAERQVGQGTVLGVAFDLGREMRAGWDGTRFVQNVLSYLAERSTLTPKPQGN
ncbi:MAG: hypothetical protein ACE5I9_04540 [Candidatus Methylomirabilales bacterium]